MYFVRCRLVQECIKMLALQCDCCSQQLQRAAGKAIRKSAGCLSSAAACSDSYSSVMFVFCALVLGPASSDES
jgi:hypothetical protein